MLPRPLVRQIRRLQIRARRAVEDLLGGEYHSVFKGSGIAFEEVRPYQPGDEVRSIDWNVTARMGQPFIKRYIEERELTVMLAVDCSGSNRFGTGAQQKREVAAELAAILAFSAISNHDRVGLVLLTDRVERFVPPRKGTRHVLRLIRDVLFFQPKRPGTSLRQGLDYLNRVMHRRAIVFLLSDFLDRDFDKALQRTGRRHDLVAIRITDPGEEELPAVGLLRVRDPETGEQRLLDTSGHAVQSAFREAARMRRENFTRQARSARADVVDVATDGDHLEALMRFFRKREHRLLGRRRS
jgi:uncharacterized protein (DUF58 family)